MWRIYDYHHPHCHKQCWLSQVLPMHHDLVDLGLHCVAPPSTIYVLAHVYTYTHSHIHAHTHIIFTYILYGTNHKWVSHLLGKCCPRANMIFLPGAWQTMASPCPYVKHCSRVEPWQYWVSARTNATDAIWQGQERMFVTLTKYLIQCHLSFGSNSRRQSALDDDALVKCWWHLLISNCLVIQPEFPRQPATGDWSQLT